MGFEWKEVILNDTIFDSFNIKGKNIRNRLVRSATWENLATETGHLTQELFDIHENLAKNEVGMIITGYANVVQEEKPNAGMIGIYDDSFIPEYQKLTKLVHKHDGFIVMQLAYGGTKTTYEVGERVIFAPSNIPERSTKTQGKAMTKDEINYIVKAFGQAARRAQESGFDGVEIHGAHTYLINQFLSPYYNNRTDEYGGCFENRFRFLAEIYEEVKKQTKADFIVGVKLTSSEFFAGGQTLDECKEICIGAEKLGFDFIEVTGNIHGAANKMTGECFDGKIIQKEGYFIEFAKEICNELTVPTITVGGFRSMRAVEEAIKSGINFVGISRPLLAEPNLFVKWKNNETNKAKCISCSKCRTEKGNYCTIFDAE